jgi:hypothetical protein
VAKVPASFSNIYGFLGEFYLGLKLRKAIGEIIGELSSFDAF